ncbi:inositol monophosphatase family protein [Companilactobacillus metriopterae]|uniref:inositol monophosphatase family protein n=1 Tax=Companilactobacillus metriopterae TaxID=1909267 RepID=UPI00100BBA34|nr:inositol monophosphatase family protein [Companilactobacillus metriopterae]
MNKKEIDDFLVQTIDVVGKNLRETINNQKEVDTKNGRNDLVTNYDKNTEKYIVSQIKEHYPGAQIISEEGFGDAPSNMDGLVFLVDPIDGTMNYVKRKSDFASMIGVYLDGEPYVGAIIDVMNNNIFHGGKGIGVRKNTELLKTPEDKHLSDGLVNLASWLVLSNSYNAIEIVKKSNGLRIYGSAGIIFSHILEGKEIVYMSRLAPWDLAAGRVLIETLGMSVCRVDEAPLNMLKSQVVIVSTSNAKNEVLDTVKSAKKL